MPEPFFDTILAGGDVVDGTGAARFRADVGIRGDRITEVGPLEQARCGQRIDVRGKVVAPGFVDTHAHDDAAVLLWPEMRMKTHQGVTTVVVGNCGISLAPSTLTGPPPPPLDLLGNADAYRFRSMAQYLRTLEDAPAAVNVAALVGHMSLRASTMQRLDRPADRAELEAMVRMLDEAMHAGAIGFSSGVAYAPSAAATTEELVTLAAQAGRHGGIYCTHLRDEGDQVVPALCEACEVAQRATLPLVVSHHKLLGKSNFGRSQETLALIDSAARRQPLRIDAYPYAASSTVLKMDRVRQSTQVLITWSTPFPSAAGRMLADVAAQMECSLEDAVHKLLPAGAIYFALDEADVQRILDWHGTMIGSDGLPQDAFPHPRLWGSFARVLGHYVRDLGLMGLEQAIHRMTGLAAHTFGLRHRGQVKAGWHADLVVFDPQQIADRATFASPTEPSTGMDWVLVNGSPVWRGGQATDHRPGRVLRRQQLDAPMAGVEARRVAP